MDWIKNVVKGLIEVYGTDNIYDLIDCLNITIIRKSMPENIKGKFLRNDFGDEFIFIDSSLERENEKFILSHELGHAILHTELSVSYYTHNQLQIKSKYEIQADKFAAELLIPDNLESCEIENMTIEQLSCYFGVPKELIEYKFRKG